MKGPLSYRGSDPLHKAEVVTKVMDTQELRSQHLLHPKEVIQVTTRVSRARETVAGGIKWLSRLGVKGVFDIYEG
jgi:hypothetical protein